jgi:hypothetical protein
MTYIKSVRTPQEKHYIPATRLNWLILLWDATENQNTQMNSVGRMHNFTMLKQVVHKEPLGLRYYTYNLN